MNNNSEYAPRIATHPGIVLQRELDAREIKQSDLAKELGMSASQLNEIVKGKRPISPELAILLEAALEIDAPFWNNAQASYNLDVARQQSNVRQQADIITQWRIIKDLVPLKFFKKQGVVTGLIADDVRKIFDIFSIDSIEELQQRLSFGGSSSIFYKKSGKLKTHIEYVKAWVAYIKYLSQDVKVNTFEFDSQEAIIASLRKVFLGRNVLENLSKTLAANGIKLIIKDKPDHAPIDGAALWSNDNRPIIGLTLRYNRIDNLAFTVYHELAHIFLHLRNNTKVSYVDNTVEDATGINSDVEEQANKFAGDILIPSKEWRSFIDSSSAFDDASIKKFAARIGSPAASVRGRLCHEGLLSYARPTEINYHVL
ncbi:HigA family addiction module antitoxin [Hymenobacter sp. ASUV-10]|uniref:HigA family addiction module antitoxin n=1 Tax=Hymenobacter aranciens TaxID=3063996 RepID=A0ABT9B7I8_9BACT|nr:HigA family addiction module antitoxin [Hymenobacter sp. ASUV-10]MDO7874236.1 HigA family addiction module antitoxin [Hymenobacter sp. ASUV-10]